nr:hypothetical protein [Tanacetum cinerariifolium]GFA34603.1 protein root hair defective 3 [Tanacetum cinerariifolium]
MMVIALLSGVLNFVTVRRNHYVDSDQRNTLESFVYDTRSKKPTSSDKFFKTNLKQQRGSSKNVINELYMKKIQDKFHNLQEIRKVGQRVEKENSCLA